MKTPAVSVLIPTYNYAGYLPEAINSVLAQDFEDFEVIIADDASTDDTVEVCRMYEAKDSRIRFIRHEKNLGMVENWNWCLQQARGKYIKYLLADDKFAKPYALTRLVKALEQPGVSLSVSARRLIDEKSQVTGIWNPLGLRNRIVLGEKLIPRCLSENANLIGEPTAVLFRKADALRGFDLCYRQLVDLEMWFHLLQKGNLAYIGETLCCFRRHHLQQTEQNRKAGRHIPEMISLFDQYGQHCARGWILFKRINMLRKSDDPAHKELITATRKQLTTAQFAGWLVLYRLKKPFINLRKSVNKRMHRILLCREQRSCEKTNL